MGRKKITDIEKIEKIMQGLSEKDLITLTRKLKKMGKKKQMDLERNVLNQEQDELLLSLNGMPEKCP